MRGLPCKNINLPKREKLSKPTHCNLCKVELTPENWKHYMGRVDTRCRKCVNESIKKYNDKRKKVMQQDKWF